MSQTYSVTIHHEGKTETISVPSDRTILEVAEESGLYLPGSCYSGVCTTCAGKVISGSLDQSQGAGISKEIQAQGYTLLCISYPRSDLEIEAGKEDEVYDLQFGV